MKQLELIPRKDFSQILDDLGKLIMVSALAYIALKKYEKARMGPQG